jgi:pimeloyl-ACP methyl ester carboxylesterase
MLIRAGCIHPQLTVEVRTLGTFHAVIYIHGMGDQQRHAELSRLTDSLERYSKTLSAAELLSPATPHNEPLNGNPGKEIAYLQMRQGNQPRDYRCYEAYWAPITAGGTNELEVLRWMLLQWLNPLGLLRDQWRDKSRMRRLKLHQLRADETNPLKAPRQVLFQTLFNQYATFISGPTGNRSFGQFKNTLNTNTTNTTILADRWHAAAIKAARDDFWALLLGSILVCLLIYWQLSTLVAFITVGTETLKYGMLSGVLTLFDSFGFSSLFKAINASNPVGPASVVTWIFKELPKIALENGCPALLVTVLTFVVFTFGLGGLGYATWRVQQFLRDFMGDVQQWTTYRETSAKNATREKILEATRVVFQHVMDEPDCDGITVIAHSLGSTIAYDVLSRYGRLLRAEQEQGSGQKLALQLEKIKSFITIGCPVDKIFFFFESQSMKYKEFNKLVEWQRGDVSSEPFRFTYAGTNLALTKHHIRWLNLFDRGDIISGPVFSANPETNLDAFVENVQISSFRFPSAASHGAYFDHHDVMRVFYDAIFPAPIKARIPLPSLPLQPLDLNPGSSRRADGLYNALLIVPVLSLATFIPGILCSIFPGLAAVCPWVSWLPLAIGWMAAALLVTLVVISTLSSQKHLHPI